MATTDSDHLPFRTITGADSFDTWRRITNSIGRDTAIGIPESGHLYLDNFDWTNRLVNPRGPEPLGGGHVNEDFNDALTTSELEAFEAQTSSDGGSLGNFNMAINGATGQSGVTLNPNSQQAYFDYANGGVRITGASNQWIRIKTRIPIDPNAQYRIKFRIKNLSPSGNNRTNRVYFSHLGLNSSFLALFTDARRTMNYFVADHTLPSNAAGDKVSEFTTILGPGYNPLYVSSSDASSGSKFDPGAKYFDLSMINYYTTGDSWISGNDIVIQGIEIERLPAGITITEHDDVDGVPRAKLQVGYQNEFTSYSNDNSTLFVNGDIQLTDGNNSDQTGRALIFNDSGTGFGVDHIFSSNNPTDATSQDFHIVTTGRFRTGRESGEEIFYRGRDYNTSTSGHTTNSTPGTGLNGSQFTQTNYYNVLKPGSANVSGNQSDTFYPVAKGEDTHKSQVHVGTIVAETQSKNSTFNSMRAPLMIGRHLQNDGSEDGEVVPLLHLGTGSFRSIKSGGGPAIDFHLPDLTGDGGMMKHNVHLPYTHHVARIACIKQSAFEQEDATDQRPAPAFLSNDERGPVGSLQFCVGSNSMTAVPEVMRISPSNSNSVTVPANVYIGLSPSNRPANLNVTGDIKFIKGLQYEWPTVRTGGNVQGETRVLASDQAGKLAWKTVSSVSVTQSVTTQSVTAPLGTIMTWAGHSTDIPNDFVECKGQTIQSLVTSGVLTTAERTALFGVISTKYGGTGETTAKLPDFRRRVPVGRNGTTNFSVGDTAGDFAVKIASNNNAGTTTSTTTDPHTLTLSEIPSHRHSINASVVRDIRGGGGGHESNFRKTGTTNTTSQGGGQSHSHGIPSLTVNLDSQEGSTFSNMQPYVAVTYIIKVKADVVKSLDVSLGSFLDSTDTADHSGTKSDVLTFDSRSLRLAEYHPTWNADQLKVHGFDLRLNTKEDGTTANADRKSGLALAALGDRLEVNYQGQIGDVTRIGTTTDTKLEVRGNVGTSGDHIIANAAFTTFGNLDDYTNPSDTNLPNRTMTINHANRFITANNTRVSDINSGGDKALVTREYLTSDRGGSHYRPGEIIEVISGHCTGDTVTYGSRSFTLPLVNASQFVYGSAQDPRVTQAQMLYTPPAGTKYVNIEYDFCFENEDTEAIGWTFNGITPNGSTAAADLLESYYFQPVRKKYDGNQRGTIHLQVTYEIDSTISIETEELIRSGKLKSWDTDRRIALMAQAYSNSYNFSLFEDHNAPTINTLGSGDAFGQFNTRFATRLGDNASNAQYVEPHIKITAIAG